MQLLQSGKGRKLRAVKGGESVSRKVEFNEIADTAQQVCVDG
jgi:hypothetical protein